MSSYKTTPQTYNESRTFAPKESTRNRDAKQIQTRISSDTNKTYPKFNTHDNKENVF